MYSISILLGYGSGLLILKPYRNQNSLFYEEYYCWIACTGLYYVQYFRKLDKLIRT